MSRHIQVTFDAHDPRALSTFWRDTPMRQQLKRQRS